MKQLMLLLTGACIYFPICAHAGKKEKSELSIVAEAPSAIDDSTVGTGEQPAITDPKANNFGGLKILIGGGISQIDHSNFNTMAAVHGFPTLRDNLLGSFNCGFILREKKENFFLDYMISIMLASRQETANYFVRQQQLSGDLNLNYAILDNRMYSFYPSLGFGFLSSSVNYEANMSSVPFLQSMTSVTGERNYESNWNFYLNPHLAYDFKIGKSKKEAIQLRAGYRIGINQPRWQVGKNQQKLEGAPKSTANGFYAALCLAL